MKHGWILAWLLQIAAMLAVCLVQAFTHSIHPGLYAVGLWGLAPLAGLYSAYRAVRRGLSNYLAWLAPPACLYAAHMLLWGFAPSAGAGLLATLLALVGAAAGEVVRQRESRRKK